MLVDDEERPVDWSPQQLAVADGGVVWVVDRGLLVRLDADTGRVIASVRATTGDTHSALAATPSGIWVDDHRDVLWIDGATNRVAGRIDGLDVIVALAADQEALWVADSGDDRLARLDPRRQKAVS